MRTRRLFAGLVLGLLSSVGWAAELDINTASAAQIARAMRGVGPNKAEAIVLYREHNGPFSRIEDLARVRGIGKTTVEINRDVITVGSNTTAPRPQSTLR